MDECSIFVYSVVFHRKLVLASFFFIAVRWRVRRCKVLDSGKTNEKKKILCTNEFYQYSIRCVSTVLWFLNIHLTSVSISSHKYSCECWVLSICRYFKKVHRPPQQWLHFDYSFFAMHTQHVRKLSKWAIFHVFFFIDLIEFKFKRKTHCVVISVFYRSNWLKLYC